MPRAIASFAQCAALDKANSTFRFAAMSGGDPKYPNQVRCEIIDKPTGQVYVTAYGGDETTALAEACKQMETATKPMTAARTSELVAALSESNARAKELEAKIKELEGKPKVPSRKQDD